MNKEELKAVLLVVAGFCFTVLLLVGSCNQNLQREFEIRKLCIERGGTPDVYVQSRTVTCLPKDFKLTQGQNFNAQ